MSDTAAFSYTPTPDFDLQRQQALGAYNSALDQMRQRQRDLLNQSGYESSTDANGNVQQGGLDAHNTYGTMQRMYGQQGQDLIHGAYAQHSRNIGHFGLANQASSAMRFSQTGQRVDAGNSMLGNMNDMRSSIAAATQQYTNTQNSLTSQQADFNNQQQAANAGQAASAAAAQQSDSAIAQLLHQLVGGANTIQPGVPFNRAHPDL